MSVPFDALREDFLRITGETVFCVATTVDPQGRPRGRMLHPIFVAGEGGPLGWALTGRTPLKSAHLAANPHLSSAFWNPSQDTVFADCRASWVEEDGEREHVWELFLTTPEPLGWGEAGMAGYGAERWRNPVFTPLRLEPWRLQVMRGAEYPAGELTGRVWRA